MVKTLTISFFYRSLRAYPYPQVSIKYLDNNICAPRHISCKRSQPFHTDCHPGLPSDCLPRKPPSMAILLQNSFTVKNELIDRS